MNKARVHRFRVISRERRGFDGADEATVEIRFNRMAHDGMVSVRPLRRRTEYMLVLSEVARYVVWNHARILAAERKARSQRSRRGPA